MAAVAAVLPDLNRAASRRELGQTAGRERHGVSTDFIRPMGDDYVQNEAFALPSLKCMEELIS